VRANAGGEAAERADDYDEYGATIDPAFVEDPLTGATSRLRRLRRLRLPEDERNDERPLRTLPNRD
jgi:hypothetical protein